jgi:predicted dehydrogenase
MKRIGVIGLGGMGRTHCSKYAQMPDVEVHAYDIHPERTEASRALGTQPVASEEDLLSSVDALDICLPTDLHLEYVEKAAANGLHVLVEKPLGLTLPQCEKMLEVTNKAGVTLMPAQTVRFFPDYAEGHRQVSAGAVGAVAAVRMHRGGRAPGGEGKWFHDFDRSGGVLLDLAVHDFDWLNWTIGKVVRVFSKSVRLGAGRWANESEQIGEYALTTLSTENGAVAHVATTWLDPSGFRTAFEICGNHGLLEYDSRQTPALRVATEDGQRLESRPAPSDDPYYLQLSEFVACLEGDREPSVSAEDGMRAVAVSLAAIESAKSGTTTVPAFH